MKNLSANIAFCVVLLIFTLLNSCVEEKYTTDPSHVLEFSTTDFSLDTAFDATATWRLIVYNRNSKAVNISSIRLLGGKGSSFRLNVDGRHPDANNSFSNISISARDSIFILVEGDASHDLWAKDSIEFVTNGTVQHVSLSLVGIDAVRLDNYQLKGDEVFDSVRPYLVNGYLYVPEGSTLTLSEGTSIYMRPGANIVVDGNLVVDGSAENNVLIRGSRFDDVEEGGVRIPYRFIPGQWGGIYLQNAHSDNRISYARIYGAGIGVILFGAYRSEPKLLVEHSILHCFDSYGIYAQMADVTILDSEISNCGASCFLAVGGSTLIQQSTLADYFTFATRKTPAFRLLGYIEQYGVRTAYNIDRCVIENSIIYGNISEEFELLHDSTLTQFTNIHIANSLIRTKEERPWFVDCIIGDGSTTVFERTKAEYTADSISYFDFHLAEQSAARGIANPGVSSLYPLTLDLQERDLLNAGAY